MLKQPKAKKEVKQQREVKPSEAVALIQKDSYVKNIDDLKGLIKN